MGLGKSQAGSVTVIGGDVTVTQAIPTPLPDKGFGNAKYWIIIMMNELPRVAGGQLPSVAPVQGRQPAEMEPGTSR